MANPHKGEVSFEASGKTWSLRYSTNALCELEDDLDRGIGDVIESLQTSPRLNMLRAVLRAGLSGHKVNQQQAGDLIDELGFDRTRELIGTAFARAFPPVEEAGDGERPRKGGGTGRSS